MMMEEEEEQKIIVNYDENENRAFSWKKLAVFMGPGFLMSIAYLDPGMSYFREFLDGGGGCNPKKPEDYSKF